VQRGQLILLNVARKLKNNIKKNNAKADGGRKVTSPVLR